ncbi:hypothetical protein MSWAN_2083 [Methanobacterium paludis]|uniref:DUF4013 domain-containing protein n=2 Tax=Methanobacterium paludis (strain DSM 25820 / JCM 18151 / SWAN1) TaxID=868131 RepID=F6D2W2_METPW|nr:hypothetical protein MSWAN_2083 [Methanobacterium paludis]
MSRVKNTQKNNGETMDVGEISSNALKYSLSNFKKVLILGILTITSFLIIPGFLVLGYLFKILKESLNGFDNLPEFNEWSKMFIDGLKVFFVILVYSIIPAALIGVGMRNSILPLINTQGTGPLIQSTLSFGILSGLTIIGILLGILVSFVIAVALANMACQNKLDAAFRFGEIFKRIGKIGWVDYIIWYIVMILVAIIVYSISSTLILIFIGIILVPLIITPYFAMFYARSAALIYTSTESEVWQRHPHIKH